MSGENGKEDECFEERTVDRGRRSRLQVDTKIPLWGLVTLLISGFGVGIAGIWRLAHIDSEFDSIRTTQREASVILRELLSYSKQFAIDKAVQDGVMRAHDDRLRRLEEDAREGRNARKNP